jgi:hypothetical protein
MGSITAVYATGKEAVVAQLDHEYARSAPENTGGAGSRLLHPEPN